MNSKRVSAWIFSLLFLVAWPFELPVAEETALGKTAFETRCVQCHDQAGPATKIAEDWWEKLNAADSGGQLSQQEQTEAISFLQHHDRKVTEMVVTATERRLFEEKCNLCHIADRVFLEPLTPVTRRHIIQRMQQRAPDWISHDEAEAILAYLDQGAPGMNRPESGPMAVGPAESFRQRCSGCHALERVYLYLDQAGSDSTAWIHIVNRMRHKAPDWISEEEAAEILGYLQSMKGVTP